MTHTTGHAITRDDVLEVIRDMPTESTVSEILAKVEALQRADRELRDRENTQLLKWFP